MPELQEQSGNSLDQKLGNLETKLDHLSSRFEKEFPEKKDHAASRLTVTGAFALIGFKVFALIGGKISFLTQTVPLMRANGDAIDLQNELNKGLIKTTVVASIAGAVGAVIGGIIGLTRGDRIEKPQHLFTKPVESFKKIFGPKPVEEAEPSSPSAIAPTLSSPSQSTNYRTDWAATHLDKSSSKSEEIMRGL